MYKVFNDEVSNLAISPRIVDLPYLRKTGKCTRLFSHTFRRTLQFLQPTRLLCYNHILNKSEYSVCRNIFLKDLFEMFYYYLTH